MFIRNNGLLDGVPSFTTLYSRCAHLGCPVQPNGPVEDDQKKTYGDNVKLIPVLAVGFGCPCHGGQYDTEGNRTAGPPVRALDRAEFSIINGNLVLGNFFSVAEVEGVGARARIMKYGRMPPGVHVDGRESLALPARGAAVVATQELPPRHRSRRSRSTRSTGWRSARASSAASSTSSSARSRGTRAGSTRSARRR